MKYYGLSTSFTFGMFSGKTLKDIAVSLPSYIGYCVTRLDHFFIDAYTISELTKINSQFSLSEEALFALAKKSESMGSQCQKIWNIEDEFQFGMYCGKSLKEVAKLDFNYIDWCLINYRDFHLNPRLVDELIEVLPSSKFSEEALTKIENRKSLFDEEPDDCYATGRSYDDYGGIYGLDDETIDEAFDGDPSNYWNVD